MHTILGREQIDNCVVLYLSIVYYSTDLKEDTQKHVCP